MTGPFDADYRSPGGEGDSSVRVLYVGRDEAVLDAVVQYVERERGRVDFWGTVDPDQAMDALDSTAWACVIVDDGVDRPDCARLARAATCPAVFSTSDIEVSLAGDVQSAFDAFVEKCTDEDCLADIFDVVETGRDDPGETGHADALVRDVVRELGSVRGRDELEAAVCERLVELDAVTMAWFGKREGASDRIVPGTTVGEPQEYLREVTRTTSREDAECGPSFTALESGEVVRVDDFRTDETVDQWRELALSFGIQSLVVVPITHGETVHGVLCVYGTEPGAFGDPLVERFSLLGDAIGFAMTAVQNKRLLQQDAAIELEFRSEEPDAFLGGLASAACCRLETEGQVDVSDEILQYVSVTGTAVECVVEAADGIDDISSARVVRAEDDGGVVEVRTPTSLQTQLSDVGARLREAVATPSAATLTVEAPVDADVRSIHAVVERCCADAELVTKREFEQPPQGRTDDLAAASTLTDRQREVLHAAYLAGYYAWPRDTTAEDLADSLDIASPTLHQHLRRAERNVLAALFDS